jgi:hypothetical protein
MARQEGSMKANIRELPRPNPSDIGWRRFRDLESRARRLHGVLAINGGCPDIPWEALTERQREAWRHLTNTVSPYTCAWCGDALKCARCKT